MEEKKYTKENELIKTKLVLKKLNYLIKNKTMKEITDFYKDMIQFLSVNVQKSKRFGVTFPHSNHILYRNLRTVKLAAVLVCKLKFIRCKFIVYIGSLL